MRKANYSAAFVVVALAAFSSNAQIQQAWLARYNNGLTNGTNQAVKMALDATGNIYVTGFSQNTNTNLGYVTIKYAPNGTQLWVARYDSTNYPIATPTALALDSSNNVFVTGSAVTVKYDTNGSQLWTAPYAGTALTLDTNGNVAVTGFGTSFNSVTINPTGTTLWKQTYTAPCGAAEGQAINADSSGNFYVAGSYPNFCEGSLVVYELLVIKYNANGSQIWTTTYQLEGGGPVQVEGVRIDGNGNAYILCDFYNLPYTLLKYDPSSSLAWVSSLYVSGLSIPHDLVVDKNYNVAITGQVFAESFLFEYGS
jgi:hypothetical protein